MRRSTTLLVVRPCFSGSPAPRCAVGSHHGQCAPLCPPTWHQSLSCPPAGISDPFFTLVKTDTKDLRGQNVNSASAPSPLMCFSLALPWHSCGAGGVLVPGFLLAAVFPGELPDIPEQVFCKGQTVFILCANRIYFMGKKLTVFTDRTYLIWCVWSCKVLMLLAIPKAVFGKVLNFGGAPA